MCYLPQQSCNTGFASKLPSVTTFNDQIPPFSPVTIIDTMSVTSQNGCGSGKKCGECLFLGMLHWAIFLVQIVSQFCSTFQALSSMGNGNSLGADTKIKQVN